MTDVSMDASYIITWKPSTENSDLGWDEANLTKLHETFKPKRQERFASLKPR
jgi:hypothetical protein